MDRLWDLLQRISRTTSKTINILVIPIFGGPAQVHKMQLNTRLLTVQMMASSYDGHPLAVKALEPGDLILEVLGMSMVITDC